MEEHYDVGDQTLADLSVQPPCRVSPARDLPADQSQMSDLMIGQALRVTRPSLVTTAVGVGLASLMLIARLGLTASLPAYLYFIVVGVALAAIDARTKKLPDRLTLPSYPILIILLSAAEAASPNQGSMVHAATAAALLVALFFVSALVGGVGLGDVKLAGLLGLVLGFRSWTTVYASMLVAFVLAAIFVLLRVIQGRGRERLPLGPFLVAGTIVAVLL